MSTELAHFRTESKILVSGRSVIPVRPYSSQNSVNGLTSLTVNFGTAWEKPRIDNVTIANVFKLNAAGKHSHVTFLSSAFLTARR